MTTKIEEIRKELEDNVNSSSSNNTEVCSFRYLNEQLLEGFEIGVEMTRKEFLDELSSFNINKFLVSDRAIDLYQGDYSENELIELVIEELKQSLGEKGK